MKVDRSLIFLLAPPPNRVLTPQNNSRYVFSFDLVFVKAFLDSWGGSPVGFQNLIALSEDPQWIATLAELDPAN